jgi:hypothetical protein
MINDFSKVQILTNDSLFRLRNKVWDDPLLVGNSLDSLVDSLDLKLEESPYTIDLAVGVKLPKGKNVSDNFDVQNSLLMAAALPGMLPALATDERLWVTLALGAYRDYSLKRWLPEKADTEQLRKYASNHIFGSTTRDFWRNQSVARLWWMHRYATQLSASEPQKALSLLLLNSDIISQVLGKPSIGTSKNLAQVIFEVAHEALIANKTHEYRRDAFRSFMRRLDLLAGRTLLTALSTSDLRPAVKTIFDECFAS